MNDCIYCGRSAPDVTLEVDHRTPKARGGTDDPSNLVTACMSCNRGKHTIILELPHPTQTHAWIPRRQAERWLIGGLLRGEDLWIAEQLDRSNFEDPRHWEICAAIAHLHEAHDEEINPSSVAAHFLFVPGQMEKLGLSKGLLVDLELAASGMRPEVLANMLRAVDFASPPTTNEEP